MVLAGNSLVVVDILVVVDSPVEGTAGHSYITLVSP